MSGGDVGIVAKPLARLGGVEQYVDWLSEVFDASVYTLREEGFADEHDTEVRTIDATTPSILGRRPAGGLLDRLAYAFWTPPLDHDVLVTTGQATHDVLHRPGQIRIHLLHGVHRGAFNLPTQNRFSSNPLLGTFQRLNRLFLRDHDATALSRADAIVVNSEFIGEMVEHYYGFDPDAVIPPPVDTSEYYDDRPTDESFYLYVGRLDEAKGVAAMVDAFADLDHDLVVAGDGPQAESLRERATDNVRFPGFVSEERKRELLARCRGFVQNTVGEPFGITTVEALASGAPVVAVDDGNNPNLIEDGQTGVLFERDGPDAPYREPGGADALRDAIARADAIDWDHEVIRQSARAYDQQVSREEWTELLAAYRS